MEITENLNIYDTNLVFEENTPYNENSFHTFKA